MQTSYRDPNIIRQALTQARHIAVVGHSHKPQRPSYQIGQFLRAQGYHVYPVNPTLKMIDGEPCYTSLQSVPVSIDIVNVFRRSEFLPGIVDDILALDSASPIKCLWTQLDIWDETAAQRAIDAGWHIVMDACIKIEHQRL
ncbi:MAG: CoA-binding protein [Cyanobacteria bacterium P01_G01_bin.38]